jgi:septal ring factor EnvC (AmiA/AmiB activator)
VGEPAQVVAAATFGWVLAQQTSQQPELTLDMNDVKILGGLFIAAITALLAWRRFRPDTVTQITSTVENALRIANEATQRVERELVRERSHAARLMAELEDVRQDMRVGRQERLALERELAEVKARVAQLEAELSGRHHLTRREDPPGA